MSHGLSGFADVDRSDHPDQFVEFLERAKGVPAITESKRVTVEVLALRPGERALDVGCGLGDEVRAMGSVVGPTGRAVGVDFSETMVRQARQAGVAPNIGFLVGDVRRLPFPDGSFDAVRIERSLQHVDDLEAAVAEMVRVLSAGGRLVAVEPDWLTVALDHPDLALTRRLLPWAASTLSRSPDAGRRLRGLLTRAGLLDVVVQAGVVAMTDPGPFFTMLVPSLGEPFREDLLAAASRATGATVEELEHWRESARGVPADAFFACVTVMLAIGRKRGVT